MIFSTDTQQLVTCNIRSYGNKRLFIIVGSICICFLIVLVYLLCDGVHSESEKFVNDRHKRSIISDLTNVATKKIIGNNLNNVKTYPFFGRKQVWIRPKREDNLDPVQMSYDDLIVRHKRMNQYLSSLRQKFENCRSLNGEHCDHFYRRMIAVAQALNEELDNLGEIAYNIKNSQTAPAENVGVNYKVPELSSSVRRPLTDFNREEKLQKNINEFSIFPRIHEEMHSPTRNAWNINESPSINQPDPPKPSVESKDTQSLSSFRDGEKNLPMKNSNIGEKIDHILGINILKSQKIENFIYLFDKNSLFKMKIPIKVDKIPYFLEKKCEKSLKFCEYL